MSITVKTLDERKAKEELKACPKIVQDYVSALERSLENQKYVTSVAIARIKKLSEKIQLDKN